MFKIEDAKNSLVSAPIFGLVTHRLSKIYGKFTALNEVSLAFEEGKVHILFGENGAGKSTLISILAGSNKPTTGNIEIGGFKGSFRSVGDARTHGVRAVFQEFSLIPELSVADNIMLGEEPSGKFGMLAKSVEKSNAQALINELGFDLDADAIVSTLPRGKQQMVEICKAVRHHPKVLILDEPTASLSEHDTKSLFRLVDKLKQQRTAIIYITHRMHEIAAIGDVVTVLRDGRHIASVTADTPESEMIELMTGRTVDDIYPSHKREFGDVRLALKGLCTANNQVSDVSLTVRSGEIVGVAGLVGCGKSELGQACFGVLPISSGLVEVDGQVLNVRHPSEAIAKGLWYSPPDRKRDGLAMMHSAGLNMDLSSLAFGANKSRRWKRSHHKSLVSILSKQVDFPSNRLHEEVSNFSGGNQQKALLAKSLAQPINAYILDEPTVGVDVGARKSIYKYLGELSDSGAAILVISSDLQELLGLSDRLLVMCEGKLVAEFDRDNFDQHKILEKFFD